MRLTPAQIDTVKAAVARHFGPAARVALFGSRRDNDRRGGDFDFYIETDLTDADWLFDRKLKLLADLHASPAFADEKIDLLVRGHLPGAWPSIYDIARRDGLPL